MTVPCPDCEGRGILVESCGSLGCILSPNSPGVAPHHGHHIPCPRCHFDDFVMTLDIIHREKIKLIRRIHKEQVEFQASWVWATASIVITEDP